MRRAPFALVPLLLTTARLAAALQQPNGARIPSAMGCDSGMPTGLARAFACVCDQPGVCNIGAVCSGPQSCDNGQKAQCETTLWHSFNDNTCIPSNLSGLDPWKDGAITPETFRPSCALTFTVITRGTAMFRDVFGWYNVTGSAPATSDLHPMLACGDTAGKSVVLDIQKDPAYRGGDIGFFLLSPENRNQHSSCAAGDCCASLARYAQGVGYLYFSERKYNADNTGPSAFIHLVTFDSKRTPRKFYFAWEDIYGGSNNDFTDLVTSVEGVECAGGGQPCHTGGQGICGRGVTACKNGKLECVGSLTGRSESCNGVDDDCNGKVDDGASCPRAGEICHQGRCVPRCGGVEFPCKAPAECDRATGLCVAPKCVGVGCEGGKVCRGGTCVEPCDGIVCPHGQSCVGDACVDLCAGVSCGAGQVCREGVCVSGCGTCGGLQCGAGLKCVGGDCADPSCASACPQGTHCASGSCKDDCADAKCPEGQACAGGQCGGTSNGGTDGGLIWQDASAGEGGNAAADDSWGKNRPGCACEVKGAPPGGAAAILLAVGGALVMGLRSTRRKP
jgi:hypothetical protein